MGKKQDAKADKAKVSVVYETTIAAEGGTPHKVEGSVLIDARPFVREFLRATRVKKGERSELAEIAKLVKKVEKLPAGGVFATLLH